MTWTFNARWRELAAIGSVTLYLALSPRLPAVPLCPTAVFGWPSCPTCGTTRALWSLCHGRFSAAWTFNPIGYLVAAVALRRVATLLLPRSPLLLRLNADPINLALLVVFLSLEGLRVLRVV